MDSSPEPLVAFVGYQSADAESAETLHVEHALRGMTVIHDRCTFAVGTRITAEMRDAVERCDAYIPLLTPNSLYEGAEAGAPRPALDAELLPMFRRRRAVLAQDPKARRPVIAAITHDLGDPRTEAPKRVHKATGESIDSLWSLVVSQDGDVITPFDAAAVAHGVLDALLPPGTGPSTGTPLPITVASRGQGEFPVFLTIDATPILGGPDHRPGDPRQWDRFLAALCDVEHVLARWSSDRLLRVNLRTHLTGAFAFGRTFHRAGGWELELSNRAGTATSSELGGESVPISSEDLSGSGPLVVSADLIGHDPNAMVNRTTQVGDMPSGRIAAALENPSTDIMPADLVATSRALATAVRGAVSRLRPSRIDLFLVTPAPFAALLGQQLTALRTDVQLYEPSGDIYAPSLTIPASMA